MSQAIVEAEEASIQTVAVSIQALKIGPKQMTMGVFRQLPFAPLVDEESLTLRGPVWGWVNYLLDAEGQPGGQEQGERINAVWQRSGRLFRCVLSRSGHFALPQTRAWSSALAEAQRFLFARAAIGGELVLPSYGPAIVEIRGLQYTASLAETEGARVLLKELKQGPHYLAESQRTSRDEVIRTAGLRRLDQGTCQFDEALEGCRDLQKRWESLYEQVKVVGQLFIAV